MTSPRATATKWPSTVTSREREVHNVSAQSRIAKIAQLSLLALFIAGLAFSLHVIFAVHRLDPDMSQSAMLWFGVEKEGWAFLTQWRYTADNWLFSWNLLHFAIFKLFGTDPRYVFLSGWLVFVGNALAAGAIARALGGRKSALILPVLLLFSGFYVHRAGLASQGSGCRSEAPSLGHPDGKHEIHKADVRSPVQNHCGQSVH